MALTNNVKLVCLQILIFSVTFVVSSPFLWGWGTSDRLADPTTEYGECSWYARLNDQVPPIQMANGQFLDSTRLTAAHRTLPLGSFAVITNPDTGRFVTVQITDRGPSVYGRIAALSQAAFAAIADLDQKVVSCQVSPK